MKKIIDNLSSILKYLKFENPDHFYFIQIIKRRKENPDLKGDSQAVKSYYITSEEHLNNKFPEIVNLCRFHNARCYINLNRKSFEAVSFLVLKKLADCISNKTFKSVKEIYNSVCSQHSIPGDKIWVTDIDFNDRDSILNVIGGIDECDSQFETNFIDAIPTLNGCHILSHPFNVKQIEPLQCVYQFDIHKEGLTLLYYESA